jgi:hypothetical protein
MKTIYVTQTQSPKTWVLCDKQAAEFAVVDVPDDVDDSSVICDLLPVAMHWKASNPQLVPFIPYSSIGKIGEAFAVYPTGEVLPIPDTLKR